MTDTFLFDQDASPSQRARLAGGYSTPQVEATASGGGLVISGFTGGYNYSSAPAATVVGGGGSGAVLVTSIDGYGSISSIQVTNLDQGHVTPAEVVFGGDAGYSPKHPPTVALLSGTSAPGVRTAILAPATVSNGGVNFVRVIDGGTGYVGPIAVIVAPGIPNKYVVPIWAPAGALKSSTRDMISFAQAALGHLVVNGVRLDPRLRSAFQMAQKGYACETAGQRPCLSLSGLAWSSNPGDGGMAAGVSKNGGLPGFTTDVRLAPSLDLGVVVFVNSNQREETANGKKPGASADLIADNILYAIARANQR